jgi:transposase
VVDAGGIPLAVRLSAANRNDCLLLADLLDAIPPVRGKPGHPRRRPRKLYGDKGYDHRFCRVACQRRHIIPRLARRGIDSSQKLGRHRWVVERTLAWLGRFRRLVVRYERRADIHQAFLSLGCSLICWQALHR